jgi:prepilin-type N-terminal cleavage/methylation domain-containing protein
LTCLKQGRFFATPQQKAFTLIELIIVIVVTGILAGIALVGYSSTVTKSHEAAIVASASNLEREMMALTAFGVTADDAYREMTDVSPGIDFYDENLDGNNHIEGGETMMQVVDQDGYQAEFLAPVGWDSPTARLVGSSTDGGDNNDGSAPSTTTVTPTTTVPVDPNISILLASNCALPTLNHSVVTFGTNSSGLSADLRFQRVGQQNAGQGYTGSAFNGPLRTSSGWGSPDVDYYGTSILLNDNFPNDDSNVNWRSGQPVTSGSFPYDLSLWTAWTEMVNLDNDIRLEFVDNTTGPVVVTTRTGQESPTDGQRELFVAPGPHQVTIQARSDGRKFGDAIVAPNADVILDGGQNGLGQLRGFGVAKSFTHIGSNLGGDSWEPGYLTGISYSCKP